MKIPYLFATESPHVAITWKEKFKLHNESNTNGKGDDNNEDIYNHVGENGCICDEENSE